MQTGWAVLLLLLGASAAMPVASAADGNCIQLKTSTEVKRIEADASGKDELRLEPVEQIAPGDEVIYTVAAANVCRQPVDQPVITYAMPKHMVYVPESAIAPAADVDFSVDGGFHFAVPGTLEIEVGGERRLAKPAEYTHIRWSLRRPLAPQAVTLARFRAVVK